jgi:hypothetical protein
MARADTQTELADAARELQCIAEVMLTLAETPSQTDGVVPARWLVWLGDCVGGATSRLTAGLADLENTPKGNPVPQGRPLSRCCMRLNPRRTRVRHCACRARIERQGHQ